MKRLVVSLVLVFCIYSLNANSFIGKKQKADEKKSGGERRSKFKPLNLFGVDYKRLMKIDVTGNLIWKKVLSRTTPQYPAFAAS